MIKCVEKYMVDGIYNTPTLDDVEKCISIAKEKKCIIELRWIMRYSGEYVRYFNGDEDPQEFYKNRLPHIYGM